MLISYTFSRILKQNIKNGYKNVHKRFSISTNSGDSQAIKMAYNEFSNTKDESKLPLIIMHGLFGSKQNWRTISKLLEKKLSPSRTIFTVDARNHGESPHSPNHDYDHLASDLLAFLHERNISKAALMGHSMGGRAMMNFALKNPDRVEKLIVVDISPVNRSQSLEGMGLLIQAMKSVNIPNDMQMKDARKIVLEQLSTVTNRGTADFILLNFRKLTDGRFIWTLNLDALEQNLIHIRRFPDIQEKFSGPTLFIGGTKSDFIQEDDFEKIKNWFPNAMLEWVDAGHVIHFEKPAEFVDLITKFLNN